MDLEFPLPLPGLRQFAIQVVAMSFTALLLPRLTITSIFGPILMVFCLSLVNVLYWDESLFGFIPHAFNIRTVALFFVNGFLFWLLVKLLPGIEIKGFLPAIAAPTIFTILSVLIETYSPLVPWTEIYQATITGLADLKEYFSAAEPQ